MTKKIKHLKPVLKIVGGIVMLSVVIVFGMETASKITGNKDLSVFSNIGDKTLEPYKNKGGDLLKKDGEKGKGWVANLVIESDNQKTFAGGTEGKWDMNMNLWTCDEDYKNANWSGEWDWDWKINTPESNGFVSTDKAIDEISFVSEDGQASFPLGISIATAKISEKNVEVSFFLDHLGEEVMLRGHLEKGSQMCEVEENVAE